MAERDGTTTDDGRGESPAQRLDRHWIELLQELRVTQTGVQILTGFLLTLPFQQRFDLLDSRLRLLYLTAFVLAVLATILIVAPVALHRLLFRDRLRAELVVLSNVIAKLGLAVLALTLVAVTALIFGVVVGFTGGLVAACLTGVVFLTLWLVLPVVVRRTSRPHHDYASTRRD